MKSAYCTKILREILCFKKDIFKRLPFGWARLFALTLRAGIKFWGLARTPFVLMRRF